MVLIKENEQFDLADFKRVGSAGNYSLKWESKGFRSFIVVYGFSQDSVVLNENGELALILEAIADRLPTDKIIAEQNRQFVFYPKVDYIKNGGFKLEDKPGYYSVYGCSINDNGAIDAVYYCNHNRVVNVSVEIQIKQEKYNVETGLFRKKIQYSGYRKVTVLRGIRSVQKSTIFYSCMNNNQKYYMFPVPKAVLENEGYFFVRCAEGNLLRFTSSDDGIRISEISE